NDFEKNIYFINKSNCAMVFKIFDIFGNLIDKVELDGGSTISHGGLTKGVYFIEIDHNNKIEVKKILIY
ncbi:MAG: T9SS type A sorting domain-containing protein, partial [Candidatus Kapaibacteriota bacterium]